MLGAAERVVLTDRVSRDDIDDAMVRCGCRLTNVYPGSATHPGQVVFATRDRQSLLYLVEDGRLGVLYVAGTGPTIDGALDEVRAQLAHHDERDIETLTSDPSDEARYARGLALTVLTAAEPPSAEQLQVLERGLTTPVAAIRQAALVAVTYAPWPQLERAVQQLANGDPDLVVRANAERLLVTLYQCPAEQP